MPSYAKLCHKIAKKATLYLSEIKDFGTFKKWTVYFKIGQVEFAKFCKVTYSLSIQKCAEFLAITKLFSDNNFSRFSCKKYLAFWPLLNYSWSTGFYEEILDTGSCVLILDSHNTKSLLIITIIVVMLRIFYKKPSFFNISAIMRTYMFMGLGGTRVYSLKF